MGDIINNKYLNLKPTYMIKFHVSRYIYIIMNCSFIGGEYELELG